MENQIKTSDPARETWLCGTTLALLFASFLPVGGAESRQTTDFHPVDLSTSYSRGSDTFEAGTAWSAVPWGRQTFHGIPFQLGGIMELTGMGAARDGWVFPGHYSGIRVGRKAEWIHLLHGTGYDEKDGTAIARVTLNYENGEKRNLNIQYGVHVRNWWVMKSEKAAAVTDPNSRVAWTGTSGQTDPGGVTLRLFQTSLQNPLPDQLIQSMDFSSLFRRATPVIVAITVGKAGNAKLVPAVAPALAKVGTDEALDEAGLRAETLLRLEDAASGKPVANARVRLNVENEKGSYFFGEQRSDTKGTTSLEYPLALFTRISFAVMAPGYATLFHNVSISDLKKELGLKLSRGVTVGGLVRDQSGNPVSEAKVVVSAVARDEVGQSVLSEYDSVPSDSSGKWSSSALPVDFKSLSLEVTHPRFMPADFEQAESDNANDKRFSKESLLAGKAVLVLEPGISVAGTVAETTGKPVADAEVAFTDLGNPPKKQLVRTDAKGGFNFVSTQTGEFHLIARAKGYAPSHKPVDVARGLKPVSFVLTKGNALKGRVVDNTGKPVEGAAVALQSWNELQLLNWSTTTDADGRFSWDSAPDGTANFSASKPGYNTVSFAASGSGEQTVALMQTFRLSGKVVDAETKEPIKAFNVVPGRSWGMADENAASWERHEQKSGVNGQYEITLDSPRGGEVKFMVIADGYLPAATPPMSETGWHTHDFELKKGSGPKGIVQSADGKPVEGAQVAIIGVGYLSLGKAEFKNQNQNDVFIAKTDAEGRFSLPAVVASPTIVAVHDKGYGEIAGDELAKSEKIVLQPWGRIEGVAKVGTKPWADQELMLSDRGSGNRLNYDWSTYKVTTDSDGRFAMDYVPPGERQLVRLVKTSERSWAHSHITPITVKAGETLKATFGGTGRTVTGKVVLSDRARKADFNVGQHSFGTRQPRPPRAFKTREEYREWENTPEVKQARRNYRYYALRFDTNGVFRLENIPPGTYDLNIRLHEPGADQWRPGEMIGSAAKEVVVDEIPGGVTDEPLDLGTLTIQLKADLKVGAEAKATAKP